MTSDSKRLAGESPTLRPAGVADRGFVRDLSRVVFSRFGEYDQMIPEWLDGAGVWGFVAEMAGQPVGFALVGLVKLPTGPAPSGSRETLEPRRALALDLMAIAVEPDWQKRGVGRLLLGSVVDEGVRLAGTHLSLEAVSLTVAADNTAARRLFEAHGFAVLPSDGHAYPGGQEALRMVRFVDGEADSS